MTTPLDEKGLEAAHAAYAITTGGKIEGHPMANAINAYLSASSPIQADGLEVVATAWEYMGESYVDFVAMLDKREIEQGRVTNIRPLVTQSSLAAMQGERDRWEQTAHEYNDAYAEQLAEVKRLTEEKEGLEKALNWALGVAGDFRLREDGEGAYWWRKELAERAGLSYDREAGRYIVTPAGRLSLSQGEPE